MNRRSLQVYIAWKKAATDYTRTGGPLLLFVWRVRSSRSFWFEPYKCQLLLAQPCMSFGFRCLTGVYPPWEVVLSTSTNNLYRVYCCLHFSCHLPQKIVVIVILGSQIYTRCFIIITYKTYTLIDVRYDRKRSTLWHCGYMKTFQVR